MSMLASTLRRTPGLAQHAQRAAAMPSLAPRMQRRSIAKMTIVGRLAAEPEVQPTSTGQEVIRYAVGSSFGPRDDRQVSWFRVTAFEREGPRRDLMLGLKKGTLLYVEGDAKMRSFEDREGKMRSALNITQRNFEILKRPQNVDEEAELTAEEAS